MSDNNNLPQKKDNAGLALQKTGSLLSITDKIMVTTFGTLRVTVAMFAWFGSDSDFFIFLN